MSAVPPPPPPPPDQSNQEEGSRRNLSKDSDTSDTSGMEILSKEFNENVIFRSKMMLLDPNVNDLTYFQFMNYEDLTTCVQDTAFTRWAVLKRNWMVIQFFGEAENFLDLCALAATRVYSLDIVIRYLRDLKLSGDFHYENFEDFDVVLRNHVSNNMEELSINEDLRVTFKNEN